MTSLLTNGTTGFNDVNSGFSPPNPTAGTVTRQFSLEYNPWSILSTEGAKLGVFESISLSVSKVTDINNETSCFVSFGISPLFEYRPKNFAEIELALRNNKGVVLSIHKINVSGKLCNENSIISFVEEFDAFFFDSIDSVLIVMPPLVWEKC